MEAFLWRNCPKPSPDGLYNLSLYHNEQNVTYTHVRIHDLLREIQLLLFGKDVLLLEVTIREYNLLPLILAYIARPFSKYHMCQFAPTERK